MSNIVIVGGGVAGCIMCRLARKTFENVVLIEQSNDVGYQASCPFVIFQYEKFPNAAFITDQGILKQAKVKLLLNSKVVDVNKKEKFVLTANNERVNYDKLIIATGSANRPIQGALNSRNVVQMKDLKKKLQDKADMKILIVGMNLTGIKLAEALSHPRHKVVVVDEKEKLDLKFEDEFSQNILQHLKNVEVKFGIKFSPDMIQLYDYIINCTSDNKCEFMNVKQNEIIQDDSVFAIGSCCIKSISQSFAFTQSVFLTSYLKDQKIPAPIHLRNVQFQLNGHFYIRVGLSLEQAKLQYQKAKYVSVKDSYRAEFMPTHHAVTLGMIFDDDSKKVLGIQAMSKHDIGQYGQIAALVIQNQVKTVDLILQDFFFQPHFGKPFHIFNVCAVAACGSIPPFEEYK